MIIVQTPLRVSFFGGGTDIPSYYLEEGGCVLSSTIDKYIFITIKHRFDDLLRVGWTHAEIVECIDQIQHELIREAFRLTGIHEGVEITTMGDIPSAGTGLGSSSTVTVGSLHAMYSLLGEIVPAQRLAEEACNIEIDILKKPIGVQDQYIAAFGGLRFMEFSQDGSIKLQRVDLKEDSKRKLNENLLLFYTGISRNADRILVDQKRNIKDRLSILNEMKQLAYAARRSLDCCDVDAIGEYLHESWQLKKHLSGLISNGTLDEMYASARKAGATGGKITGAGGGGFLLLYVPHEHQAAVREALHGLKELPFQLEADGSKVIFNYKR